VQVVSDLQVVAGVRAVHVAGVVALLFRPAALPLVCLGSVCPAAVVG
jgi:hypothetical protein